MFVFFFFVDFFVICFSMKVATNFSQPKNKFYLDKIHVAATKNSDSEAGLGRDGSMAQLTPVSDGKGKESGWEWTFPFILGGALVLFAALTTVACCCKLTPCHG